MSKSLQSFAWIAFVVVVIGALVYGLTGNDSSQSQSETATSSEQSDPQQVTILKYSDYQCPACKAYIPLQEQLKQEFGEMVSIEYRYFPLNGHQYAQLAAQAVEAARLQGSYEEMHDKVFEGQEIWSNGNAEEIFTGYAEEIGLDMEQFEEDLHSDEVLETIRIQKAEGERRMVRATPTFFINGQKLQQNPQSYQQFRSIVEMYMYQ